VHLVPPPPKETQRVFFNRTELLGWEDIWVNPKGRTQLQLKLNLCHVWNRKQAMLVARLDPWFSCNQNGISHLSIWNPKSRGAHIKYARWFQTCHSIRVFHPPQPTQGLTIHAILALGLKVHKCWRWVLKFHAYFALGLNFFAYLALGCSQFYILYLCISIYISYIFIDIGVFYLTIKLWPNLVCWKWHVLKEPKPLSKKAMLTIRIRLWFWLDLEKPMLMFKKPKPIPKRLGPPWCICLESSDPSVKC